MRAPPDWRERTMTGGYASIRDKIERAARNGERLHLGPDQVRLLVRSPIFRMLAELVAEEVARQWDEEMDAAATEPPPTPPAGSSSDPSGSSGGRSASSIGCVSGLRHAA
jgi:hypothetical protein